MDPHSNLTFHEPHEFDRNPWVTLLFGYLSPLVIFCVIATNSLVCAILCRKNLRTPTNVFLVAMAVSDTLAGIFPLPIYLTFYTTNNYHDWIPYSWCKLYHFLIDYLPTAAHTASIWLTVCLAAQRYLMVCRPTTAKSLCTMRKSIQTVLGVYLFSLIFHSYNYFQLEFYSVNVTSKLSNISIIACDDKPLFPNYEDALLQMYLLCRVIFVNLIPCILLSLFNTVLVRAMRKAGRRKRQLLKQNMRMEGNRLKENNRTTLMLVVVVAVFLLVEIPLAIFLLLYITAKYLLPKEGIDTIAMFLNFSILLTYPMNFFIYCRMSSQFRKSFKKLFECHSTTEEEIMPKSQNIKKKESSEIIEMTINKNKNKFSDKNTCMLTLDGNTGGV